jgi:deoxynucleoside triphosphate triphosphohydrolase SAMHD1
LGHGPYTYPFSDFVQNNLGVTEWSHKARGQMLLQNIIDTQAIDLESEEIRLIQDLMLGKSNSSKFPNWLFHIVHNIQNGVDVDIFDYLQRDTYKLGIRNQSFDFQILMKTARVIDDNICYRAQDGFSIYDLFQCRFGLSKKYYLHRVSKGIELMIKDIFIESNSVYRYIDKIFDPIQYSELNDTILNQILQSDESGLEKARNLVKRIYSRDLYEFVGEYFCNSLDKNSFKWQNFNENSIINCSKSTGYQSERLEPGDIRVQKLKLNLGKGEEDPVKYVKFYDSNDNIVNVSKETISNLIPAKFQELIFRVYVTSPAKKLAAQVALKKFCQENASDFPNLYE